MSILKNRWIQLLAALVVGYGGGHLYTVADVLRLIADMIGG